MQHKCLIGPATVTYEGTDIGETHGGGNIEVKTKEVVSPCLGSDVIHAETPLYGIGTINSFELKAKAVSDSLLLYDYGQVIIDGLAYKLTLYNCQVWLPTGFSFGTNDLKPFTLRLFFKPDANGNLYNLEVK